MFYDTLLTFIYLLDFVSYYLICDYTTGCPEVTSNGINALIRGLKYVEAAISYIGFKPIDKHTEKKLSDQIDMIKGQEQYRIESREQYLRQLQQTEKAERIALEDKVKSLPLV